MVRRQRAPGLKVRWSSSRSCVGVRMPIPACDNDFVIRIFGLSVVVSVAAVIAAYFYGGTSPLGPRRPCSWC